MPEPDSEGTHRNFFVIFGAAVWSGGQPSNAMRRRTSAAIRASANKQDRIFIPSGSVGKIPPAEAIVMRDLLVEAGVPMSEIIVDLGSNDTLETVFNSEKIIRSFSGTYTVWVSTDRYHLRRCLWLFRLTGLHAHPCPVENGRKNTKLLKWIYFCVREYPAILWDTALVLVKQRHS
jgi:uncharacterized SAM-binding protein YcdF (DUF218 family)